MNAHVTAYFDDIDEATAAAKELERAGIDALHVRVAHDAPMGTSEVADADAARVGRSAGRAAAGAFGGLFAGGIVAAGIAVALSANVTAAALAGAIVGAILGAFYAVATDLSMNSDIEDNLGGQEPVGPDWLEYTGPAEDVQLVLDVVARHEPRQLVQHR